MYGRQRVQTTSTTLPSAVTVVILRVCVSIAYAYVYLICNYACQRSCMNRFRAFHVSAVIWSVDLFLLHSHMVLSRLACHFR